MNGDLTARFTNEAIHEVPLMALRSSRADDAVREVSVLVRELTFCKVLFEIREVTSKFSNGRSRFTKS